MKMFSVDRRARAVLVLAGLALTLAGCGGTAADGRFVAGPGPFPLSCLEHQPDSPGRAYTGGESGDTAAIFDMLRYYTGNKAATAYCDAKGPTATDRRWAELYVDLGAEPGNVENILG
jgi:hypothetical protein